MRRNRFGPLLVSVCFIALFAHDAICAERRYFDVHIHLDPGIPIKPQGFSDRQPDASGPRERGPMNHEAMAQKVVASMDEMGVEQAVIVPPPMIPSQAQAAGPRSFKACRDAIRYSPERLLLGGGGDILNPLIHQYGKDEITPEIRARFREEAEKLIKAGIVVFGEMSALHLSLHKRHIFSQVDPDHPLFLLLADIAAENNIPIDLHMEAVPIDMPTPANIMESSSENPPALKANVSGLERLLEHDRRAKIIWQHIGWDNIGCMTTALLGDLLKKHSNLYLALRVERRPVQVGTSDPMPNRIVDRDGMVCPEWSKLIAEFSDRIVIGSDEFMGLERRQPRPHDSFRETWQVVNQFPEGIARKIGRDNARRLYLDRQGIS